MRPGIQKNDTDSSPEPSVDGNFRKPESVASIRSTSSISSKFGSTSKRVYTVLKEYSTKLVDPTVFSDHLVGWVGNNLHNQTSDNVCHFSLPFSINDLRMFDYALEGVLFQQLLRMPCPPYPSENLKEDEFLALEDFLLTAAEGLWRVFWHKNKPLPFVVSCPRYPGSKFYTVEKAVSRGRVGSLSGAALMSRSAGRPHVHWDDVIKFALFKKNLMEGEGFSGLSPLIICEALFYAVHILFSRSLSRHNNSIYTDCIFVSILDSKFGGVVKLSGDLGKLEVDLSNPYGSMAEWITCHAEVGISHVDRIWNKLGNINWCDMGALQILLAMFYSIVQWHGPPRKSVESLAANHSLRLQKRRMETRVVENEHKKELVPYQTGISTHNGEIVELDNENNPNSKPKGPCLNLSPGETLLVDDQNKGGVWSCQIQEFLDDGSGCSYTAVSTDELRGPELLTLRIGAHPSLLEPSWEDMNLWYQVQRQTKVLNILKRQAHPSKHLPELVASGRIVHSGPCEQRGQKDRCDHPRCGAPVLVTHPAGESILSIVARAGPLSGDEAARLCRDSLSALGSARMAGVLHGDIRPENVVRGPQGTYVLVSWGRAVLEERDSPALDLRFSSGHALQHGRLCPSSDVESLVYLVYFACGGPMERQESIESALEWRQRAWGKRVVQRRLGEVSPLLKAFADYVDGVCGTPYAVDYDMWVRRFNGERGGGCLG